MYKKIVVFFIVLFSMMYAGYIAYSILTAPPDIRVMYVPDDAYYYLALARNFANSGSWTFDSGISLTTGYHPLHAYVLAGIFSIIKVSPENFVKTTVLISCILFFLTTVFALIYIFRSKSILPCLLFMLFIFSRNVSLNMVSGVEWGWVVLLSTLYCFLFSISHKSQKKLIYPLFFCCGFLGSISRTDFGLLPLVFLVVSLIGFPKYKEKKHLVSTVIGFLGTSLGLLSVFVNNYLTTGIYLQSSAKMKSLWMKTYGISFHPILLKLINLFGSISPSTKILCSGLFLIVLIYGIKYYWPVFKNNLTTQKVYNLFLWLSCIMVVIGYILFYSLNPAAIQHWYTANIIVPLFIVLSLPFFYNNGNKILYITGILILLLISKQIPLVSGFLDNPEWPHQVSMYRAGQFLNHTNFEGRVGSWNAGIIGYYEGGHVVNLDGLVNNDIYSYANENRLLDYIHKNNIKFIVDFECMFLSELRRKRGGYDIPNFWEKLTPIKCFDNREGAWSKLTLFEIESNGKIVDIVEK